MKTKNIKAKITAAAAAIASAAMLLSPVAVSAQEIHSDPNGILTLSPGGAFHNSNEWDVADLYDTYNQGNCYGVLPDGTLFDAIWYMNAYPDIQAVYGTCLFDFLSVDFPSWVVSEATYDQYADQAKANYYAYAEKLAEHYWNYGKAEGRLPIDPRANYDSLMYACDTLLYCYNCKPDSGMHIDLTPTQITSLTSLGDKYDALARQANLSDAYAYTNYYRKINGLAPLQIDPNLESYAQTRAQEATVLFSHTRPNGQPTSARGENIASGTRASTAIKSLYDDLPHRQNMLSWTKIGIGICYDGKYGALVQVFD